MMSDTGRTLRVDALLTKQLAEWKSSGKSNEHDTKRAGEMLKLAEELERELVQSKEREANARAAVVAEVIAAMPQFEYEDYESVYHALKDWPDRIRAIATTPPGHVCVPVDPDEGMRLAGAMAIQEHYRVDGGWCGLLAAQEQMILTWNAMLAASKEPT